MANQEHLAILKQGVEAWNQWRQEHPDIQPDLSGASCNTADLGWADLRGANLWRANLWRANLRDADLRGAYLIRADLRDTNLSGAHFSQADLRNANLRDADLRGAYLIRADLSRADLCKVKFHGANLWKADLSRADLSQADLRSAILTDADLSDASLIGADFSRASVGGTSFGNVNLSAVKGLETVKHGGPSTIGIDTIYLSKGNIPEVFLRGAGVDDTFITYIRSLVGKPIEYYSCFISYSSKDEAFAKRLYADLQSNNVRCWFAREDLKIGEKFWHRIDESIRLYDKLLVIISQYSVNSAWVEREVMAALEKEQQHNKKVLFPLKLDEMVMQTTFPWAADIRRTRHIGDFTRWKEHDFYQKAFTRLLRDLKAEPPKAG